VTLSTSVLCFQGVARENVVPGDAFLTPIVRKPAGRDASVARFQWVDQYAFGEVTMLANVRMRILMSRSSDQFSMYHRS